MKFFSKFTSVVQYCFNKYPIVSTTISLSSLVSLPVYFSNKKVAMQLEIAEQDLKNAQQQSDNIALEIMNKLKHSFLLLNDHESNSIKELELIGNDEITEIESM